MKKNASFFSFYVIIKKNKYICINDKQNNYEKKSINCL